MEVLEQRQRLDRAARLRGDDEQRRLDVDLGLDRRDLQRLGRVEHVQAQSALALPVGEPEDLGREARAAHAEQHRVGQPVGPHSATNASSASASSSILSAIVSQPRRSVSSGVPSGPHSVPSRCQIRRATSSSAARLTRAASGARARAAGRPRSRRAAGDDRLALALDAVEQLGHRRQERLDAVAQQLSVTSSRSIPASRSASRSPSGPPRPSRRSISLDWRAAISVGNGIVLTVWGPTSPST